MTYGNALHAVSLSRERVLSGLPSTFISERLSTLLVFPPMLYAVNTIRSTSSPRLFVLPSGEGVSTGYTSRGHTGGKSHIFLILPSAVHAFIFPVRRIQSFLSLVDREVEFCVLAI